MRLDEMIIKANADNKTYFCNGTDLEYSRENGFTKSDGTSLLMEIRLGYCPSVCVTGWKEKPKRHFTVSEAEKVLDCVIDAPDISKLLRPMFEKPEDKRNVIIVYKDSGLSARHCGFYDKDDNWWRWHSGCNPCISNPSLYYWIDPEDLIKLLPKE